MARVTLNLDAAVNYLHGVSVDQLDGIKDAVDAKMKELKVDANRRAAKAGGGGQQTGNMRSVLRWVESLHAPEDANEIAKSEHDEAVKAGKKKGKYQPSDLAAASYKEARARHQVERDQLQCLHAVISRRYSLAGKS